MAEMVEIDGRWGEGGGQILRSSLTLSVLSGRPVHLVHIRAGRQKPGLMPQHLQAAQAAAAISGAQLQGASPGSQELLFTPGEIGSGAFRFDIGTAGSTTLVLQTVFLPLAVAARPSVVTITGGTHVPFSPCFHYLQLQWLPYLRRIGLDLQVTMALAGFYPGGGGRLEAVIRRGGELHPLTTRDRGPLKRIRCLSMVAGLPPGIAERQGRRAEMRLAGYRHLLEVEKLSLPSVGKGTVLLLHAEFAGESACYFALGERGKPAERVADEAVDQLLPFLATDAAIDEHLADQLVLPLAVADGESVLHPVRVTPHLLTNLRVISSFTAAEFEVEGKPGAPGTVRIRGHPVPGIRAAALPASWSKGERHA